MLIKKNQNAAQSTKLKAPSSKLSFYDFSPRSGKHCGDAKEFAL
jgi:hypothetical protein